MIRPIRNVVVGIAGIEEEEDPYLELASQMAESLGATLYVVHAFRIPDPILYPYAEVNFFNPDVIRQLQDGVQAEIEAWVRKLSGGERIICRAVAGVADLAILDTAEEVGAELLVVGAARGGKLARAILGTTAQRVVRAARVPVLVIRRPCFAPLRRILLTTDLSAVSGKAYERGVELVTMLGDTEELDLRALLVLGYDVALPPPLSASALEEAAQVELERFLTRVEPGAPPSRGKIRTGVPAREIAAEAAEWGADLLVLGTHGRSGASRFLIGSVAESVLRRAPCNVLVVPNAVSDSAEVAPVRSGHPPS